MNRLIDSHTHLDESWDMEAVLGRAREAGVEGVVAMGSDSETCAFTIRMAEAYKGYIYPALGVHPGSLPKKDVDSTIRLIEDNLDGLVAIGEIGLDYSYGDARTEAARRKQRETYARLLELAREHNLPASVHSRGAYRDAFTLARERGPEDVVFHWYDGPLDVLDLILDSGYLVSATPAAEYSKGHRAALSEAPLECILIETDSPLYLRRHGRRSEPADVVITLRALAGLKGLEEDEVARVTTSNAEKFYRL